MWHRPSAPGALSLLACLRGQWHCSSTYLDGVFMGARNRLLPTGTEPERLPLPEALQERLRDTMERLRAIPMKKEGAGWH